MKYPNLTEEQKRKIEDALSDFIANKLTEFGFTELDDGLTYNVWLESDFSYLTDNLTDYINAIINIHNNSQTD